MMPMRGQTTPPGQAGFALIEVMVSALIAVSITGAVIGLLNSTGRAGAQERHRSQAFSIAQEDQARMRAMRISELGVSSKPREVQVGGGKYFVTSTSSFVGDKTGTPSCKDGTGSADYVKLSTTVTWPSIGSTDPAVIESIVSPVSGSLDPTRGTLAVYVKNEAGTPISGVGINGAGAGNFSGYTDSTGCALFAQPAGTYTVTPTLGAGYVNYDGEPPAAKTTTLTAGSTNTIELQYDKAGTLEVNFLVRNYSGVEVPSSADTLFVTNANMKTPDIFGTAGGTRLTKFEATPLYPFTEVDSFWAGACIANNPGSGATLGNLKVPPAGTASATLKLPPLYVTVKNGSTAINGATVKITDKNCSLNGTPVSRKYPTNEFGQLADPGLPWGTYTVCAQAVFSGNTKHTTMLTDQVVHSLTGLTAPISLTSSSSSGPCP
jgi:Tfp pilus assembly protein PilV